MSSNSDFFTGLTHLSIGPWDFGKSLHDALCEIHAESIRGKVPSISDVPKLVQDHLHLPFANVEVRENSVRGAEKALTQYLEKHGATLRDWNMLRRRSN